MNIVRVKLQPAYVLHQRPYRDTSALVEAFTADYGLITLVAKGVRAAKSRLAGVLQPFQPLLISWSGRTELVTLTGCEADGARLEISGRLAMSGFYMNELLLRLLHRHDPHPALFQNYLATLAGLAQGEREERALRIFELRLLKEIGYAMTLDHLAGNGEAVEADKIYSYQIERGLTHYANAEPGGIQVLGCSLLSLKDEALHDAQSLRDSKRLMRAVLSRYLGSKPLQSRELFINLQKLRATPPIAEALEC
ncbi:MAG: DNA repair protein RecO [Gammaproteobacteria bacterium]